MNFKKVLSLILVIVFSLTVFSGCGEDSDKTPSTTSSVNNNSTEKTIVVVGENENLGFWQNLKKGGEEAGKKYGYRVVYMGTDEGTDNVVSTHILNLENALNDNVSGVVVAPDSEGYSEIFSKIYDKKIPVVQIDRIAEDDYEKLESNKKNPIISTVSTSYEEAGALCAEKLFEKVKENIAKTDNIYVIGVIERNDKDADEEKTKGFVDKFTELADSEEKTKDKYRIEVESEEKYEDSLMNLEKEHVKAIFITHPEIADKVSDIVSAEPQKFDEAVFCGFDSGAKQMKWLSERKGPEFIGGVAQDSYNLGYNAVEQCIFAIEGKDVKETVEISGEWYDKSNSEKLKQDNIIFEK